MPTNCPAILSGYSKKCRDAQGGVKKFYVTEHENIVSYTEASGALTALTMASGKKFWLFEQEIELAHGEEVPTPNRQNGTNFWDQTFTSVQHKRAAAEHYQLRALSQQNVAIIEVEQTGTMWLWGAQNGMAMEPSPTGTGTTMGDRNGYETIWKGKEPVGALTVSQAILDTVIV